MEISFGKHAGKSVEMLVLKEPQYIKWMLAQQANSAAMKTVQDYARKKIAQFDGKPILKKCSGQSCKQPATRCTVYSNNVTSPHWWCDTCNPYQSGANKGKLQAIHTYADACQHVAIFCRERVSDYKDIILSMARAKGLPDRVGEKQAQAFFT